MYQHKNNFDKDIHQYNFPEKKPIPISNRGSNTNLTRTFQLSRPKFFIARRIAIRVSLARIQAPSIEQTVLLEASIPISVRFFSLENVGLIFIPVMQNLPHIDTLD